MYVRTQILPQSFVHNPYSKMQKMALLGTPCNYNDAVHGTNNQIVHGNNKCKDLVIQNCTIDSIKINHKSFNNTNAKGNNKGI